MAKNTTTTTEIPLYKNTVRVRGRQGAKTVTGVGTIADFQAKMKIPHLPVAHNMVTGYANVGLAVERKDLTAPKPTRGRAAKVYEFRIGEDVASAASNASEASES